MENMKNLRLLAFLPLLSLSACVAEVTHEEMHRQLAAARHQCDERVKAMETELASLKDAAAERDALRDKVASLELRIPEMEKALKDAETQRDVVKEEIEGLRGAKREADAIKEKASAAEKERDEIRSKLQEYIDLESIGVDVTSQGIRITVKETILFDSGKSFVKDGTEEILMKLSSVLSKTKAREIRIVGHSDSQPIKTREFPSNWELSTARALAILHTLVEDYGLKPDKLVAMGCAHFQPIASNNTPEGRAKNRRAEILLIPAVTE